MLKVFLGIDINATEEEANIQAKHKGLIPPEMEYGDIKLEENEQERKKAQQQSSLDDELVMTEEEKITVERIEKELEEKMRILGIPLAEEKEVSLEQIEEDYEKSFPTVEEQKEELKKIREKFDIDAKKLKEEREGKLKEAKADIDKETINKKYDKDLIDLGLERDEDEDTLLNIAKPKEGDAYDYGRYVLEYMFENEELDTFTKEGIKARIVEFLAGKVTLSEVDKLATVLHNNFREVLAQAEEIGAEIDPQVILERTLRLKSKYIRSNENLQDLGPSLGEFGRKVKVLKEKSVAERKGEVRTKEEKIEKLRKIPPVKSQGDLLKDFKGVTYGELLDFLNDEEIDKREVIVKMSYFLRELVGDAVVTIEEFNPDDFGQAIVDEWRIKINSIAKVNSITDVYATAVHEGIHLMIHDFMRTKSKVARQFKADLNSLRIAIKEVVDKSNSGTLTKYDKEKILIDELHLEVLIKEVITMHNIKAALKSNEEFVAHVIGRTSGIEKLLAVIEVGGKSILMDDPTDPKQLRPKEKRLGTTPKKTSLLTDFIRGLKKFMYDSFISKSNVSSKKAKEFMTALDQFESTFYRAFKPITNSLFNTRDNLMNSRETREAAITESQLERSQQLQWLGEDQSKKYDDLDAGQQSANFTEVEWSEDFIMSSSFVNSLAFIGDTTASDVRDKLLNLEPDGMRIYIDHLDTLYNNSFDKMIRRFWNQSGRRIKSYETFKRRYLTKVWVSLSNRKSKNFINVVIDRTKSNWKMGVTELGGTFKNSDGMYTHGEGHDSHLESYLEPLFNLLTSVMGEEDSISKIEVAYINTFESRKNGNLVSATNINGLSGAVGSYMSKSSRTDPGFAKKSLQEKISQVLWDSSEDNEYVYIFLGNYADKNITPVLRIPKTDMGKFQAAREKLFGEFYRQSLSDEDLAVYDSWNTPQGKSMQNTFVMRLLLEDMSMRVNFNLAEGEEFKSKIIFEDAIKAFKRGNKFSYEISRPYLGTERLNQMLKDKEYIGVTPVYEKVKGESQSGEPIFDKESTIIDIGLNMAVFSSNGSDGLSITDKDGNTMEVFSPEKLSQMLMNEHNLSTVDGITFYIIGELNEILDETTGSIKHGTHKNLIGSGADGNELFVKHSMQGIHRDSPLGKLMQKHSIALLVSDESIKLGKQEEGGTGQYAVHTLAELGTSNEIKTNILSIKSISKIYDSEFVQDKGGATKQLFNTAGLAVNSPLLKIIDSSGKLGEEFTQIVDNVVANSAKLLYETYRKDFNTEGLIEIVKHIVEAPRNAREEEVSIILRQEFETTKTEEDRVEALRGFIKRNTIAELIRDRIKMEFRTTLDQKITGFRATLQSSIGDLNPQVERDTVYNVQNLKDLIFSTGNESLFMTYQPDANVRSLVRKIRELTSEMSILGNIHNIRAAKKGEKPTEMDTLSFELREARVKLKKINSEYTSIYRTISFSRLGGDITKKEMLDQLKDSIINPETGQIEDGYVIITKGDAKKYGIKPGDKVIVAVTPISGAQGATGAIVAGIMNDYDSGTTSSGLQKFANENKIIMNSGYIQGFVGKDYDIDNVTIIPYDKKYWNKKKDHEKAANVIEKVKNKHNEIVREAMVGVFESGTTKDGEQVNYPKSDEDGSIIELIDKIDPVTGKVITRNINNIFRKEVRIKYMQLMLGANLKFSERKDKSFKTTGKDFITVQDAYLGTSVSSAVSERNYHQIMTALNFKSGDYNPTKTNKGWLQAYTMFLILTEDTVDMPNNTNSFFYHSDLKGDEEARTKAFEAFFNLEPDSAEEGDAALYNGIKRSLFGAALAVGADKSQIDFGKMDLLDLLRAVKKQQGIFQLMITIKEASLEKNDKKKNYYVGILANRVTDDIMKTKYSKKYLQKDRDAELASIKASVMNDVTTFLGSMTFDNINSYPLFKLINSIDTTKIPFTGSTFKEHLINETRALLSMLDRYPFISKVIDDLIIGEAYDEFGELVYDPFSKISFVKVQSFLRKDEEGELVEFDAITDEANRVENVDKVAITLSLLTREMDFVNERSVKGGLTLQWHERLDTLRRVVVQLINAYDEDRIIDIKRTSTSTKRKKRHSDFTAKEKDMSVGEKNALARSITFTRQLMVLFNKSSIRFRERNSFLTLEQRESDQGVGANERIKKGLNIITVENPDNNVSVNFTFTRGPNGSMNIKNDFNGEIVSHTLLRVLERNNPLAILTRIYQDEDRAAVALESLNLIRDLMLDPKNLLAWTNTTQGHKNRYVFTQLIRIGENTTLNERRDAFNRVIHTFLYGRGNKEKPYTQLEQKAFWLSLGGALTEDGRLAKAFQNLQFNRGEWNPETPLKYVTNDVWLEMLEKYAPDILYEFLQEYNYQAKYSGVDLYAALVKPLEGIEKLPEKEILSNSARPIKSTHEAMRHNDSAFKNMRKRGIVYKTTAYKKIKNHLRFGQTDKALDMLVEEMNYVFSKSFDGPERDGEITSAKIPLDWNENEPVTRAKLKAILEKEQRSYMAEANTRYESEFEEEVAGQIKERIEILGAEDTNMNQIIRHLFHSFRGSRINLDKKVNVKVNRAKRNTLVKSFFYFNERKLPLKGNTKVSIQASKFGVRDLTVRDVGISYQIFPNETPTFVGLGGMAWTKRIAIMESTNYHRDISSSIIDGVKEITDLVSRPGKLRRLLVKLEGGRTEKDKSEFQRLSVKELTIISNEDRKKKDLFTKEQMFKKVFKLAENLRENYNIVVSGNGNVDQEGGIVYTYFDKVPLDPEIYGKGKEYTKEYTLTSMEELITLVNKRYNTFNTPEDKLAFYSALRMREALDVQTMNSVKNALTYFDATIKELNELGGADAQALELVKMLKERYSAYLVNLKGKSGNFMPHIHNIDNYEVSWKLNKKLQLNSALTKKINRNIQLKAEGKKHNASYANITEEEEVKKRREIDDTVEAGWSKVASNAVGTAIIPDFMITNIEVAGYIQSDPNVIYSFSAGIAEKVMADMITADALWFRAKGKAWGESSGVIQKGLMWYADITNNPMLHSTLVKFENIKPGMKINFIQEGLVSNEPTNSIKSELITRSGVVKKVTKDSIIFAFNPVLERSKMEGRIYELNSTKKMSLRSTVLAQILEMNRFGFVEESYFDYVRMETDELKGILEKAYLKSLNNLEALFTYKKIDINNRDSLGDSASGTVSRFTRRGWLEVLEERYLDAKRARDLLGTSSFMLYRRQLAYGAARFAGAFLSFERKFVHFLMMGTPVNYDKAGLNWLGTRISDWSVDSRARAVIRWNEWTEGHTLRAIKGGTKSARELGSGLVEGTEVHELSIILNAYGLGGATALELSMSKANIEDLEPELKEGWGGILKRVRVFHDSIGYEKFKKKHDMLIKEYTNLTIEAIGLKAESSTIGETVKTGKDLSKVILKLAKVEKQLARLETLWRAKKEGLLSKMVEEIDEKGLKEIDSIVKEATSIKETLNLAEEKGINPGGAVLAVIKFTGSKLYTGKFTGVGLFAVPEKYRVSTFYISLLRNRALGAEETEAIRLASNMEGYVHARYSAVDKAAAGNTKIGKSVTQYSQFSMSSWREHLMAWHRSFSQKAFHAKSPAEKKWFGDFAFYFKSELKSQRDYKNIKGRRKDSINETHSLLIESAINLATFMVSKGIRATVVASAVMPIYSILITSLLNLAKMAGDDEYPPEEYSTYQFLKDMNYLTGAAVYILGIGTGLIMETIANQYNPQLKDFNEADGPIDWSYSIPYILSRKWLDMYDRLHRTTILWNKIAEGEDEIENEDYRRTISHREIPNLARYYWGVPFTQSIPSEELYDPSEPFIMERYLPFSGTSEEMEVKVYPSALLKDSYGKARSGQEWMETDQYIFEQLFDMVKPSEE